jgi:peptide/nickel transport system permease protein
MSTSAEVSGLGIRRTQMRRAAGSFARSHPIAQLVIVRVALGVVTLFAVSIVIFAATQALPGNAAYAVLGHGATPQRVHALELQLHLNRSLVSQYGSWIGGVLKGNFGTSLANNESVAGLMAGRLENSAVLVFAAGIIGSLLAGLLGLAAASRRDGWFDHIASVIALVITAMPEFNVGIALVILLAVNVTHLLPAVSTIPPGTHAWDSLNLLILPVATLAIVIAPYIFRMVRAGERLRRDGGAEGRLAAADHVRARATERAAPDHPGGRLEPPVSRWRHRGRRVRVQLSRCRGGAGRRGVEP